MRDCGPGVWVDFERTDLDYVRWRSQGLSADATAAVEAEHSGTWWPLTIDHTTGDLIGYFAGPDNPTPGSAHVIPVTSHLVVRVSDDGVQRDLDGGFIRLIP